MKKFLLYFFVIFFILIVLFAFSSSYTYDNIDNLAYVIAIGIDKSTNNQLKVSFQFTNTSAYSSEGSSENNQTIIDTVESQSIHSSINLLNSYVGKNVNLAHCKVIVFSEAIAKEGISNYIYSFINDSQIRPTANIVISKCDAKYYLENSISKNDNVITKYYDMFPNSSDYTGYISDITLGNFFNQITNTNRCPVAILGGINSNSMETPNKDTSSILANNSTISGERGTENIGLAVFKDDKLVGELTALEALCHSIIENKVNTFLISVPNPKDNKSTVDLSANQYKKAKINIDVSNGSPLIKVTIFINAKILSIDDNINYFDNSFLDEISTSANSYLSSTMSDYLYKTSKEYKTCINSFSNYAVKDFLTTKDWDSYNWKSAYNDAFFDVNVQTTINSSLLLTES